LLRPHYQKALAHELGKAGLKAGCEKAIAVYYDGVAVGDCSADRPVADRGMLELKANPALAPANEVPLANDLTATGIEVGPLLNLGAERLEFKRKSRTYRPKTRGAGCTKFTRFQIVEFSRSCTPSCFYLVHPVHPVNPVNPVKALSPGEGTGFRAVLFGGTH